VRLKNSPSPSAIQALNEDFADIMNQPIEPLIRRLKRWRTTIS